VIKKYTDISQIDATSPFKLLEQAYGAYIKQKIEMVELITGCETKNRYTICLRINGWSYLYKAFKCKEESSWCIGNCCSGESRKFKMLIKYSPNGLYDKGDNYNSNLFAELDRPYKCTCFNLNRPELSVSLTDGTNLGKITEPFSCSRVLVDIRNGNGELKYKIDIDWSQPGIACRSFLCGAIESVDFPIQNINKMTGESVLDGEIKRMGRSYAEAVVGSDTDCFDIIFPKNATPEEKFLILSSTLLIDYRFFEDTEKE